MVLTHLTYRSILLLAMLAGTCSLGVAFVSQYGFGLTPCELCIAQRIPYGVVIILGFIGLWVKPKFQAVLCSLAGLSFLVDAGIAAYHALVEKHWVKGPGACTDSGKGFQTMDEFLNKINHAAVTACDQPQWQFHGITMASLNALWACFCTIAIICALQQLCEKGKTHA